MKVPGIYTTGVVISSSLLPPFAVRKTSGTHYKLARSLKVGQCFILVFNISSNVYNAVRADAKIVFLFGFTQCPGGQTLPADPV